MKPNRLPLLRGLDGLRAFSVAAVLIYHAQAMWLPGGFLGVEFFFVISGFLITAQLLIEWRGHGTINLGAFWQRRARRLLPAVFLLLFVVLTGSLLFMRGEVAEVREGAFASMAYVTNWYLIFNHQSYFESLGRPPLLQHLWSLAVEEQFYVVWPLLLSFALRWMRPAFVLPCVIALAVWSSLLMIGLHARGVDPDRLYYGTDTRAAGLLIGSALAFVWSPWVGAMKVGWRYRLTERGLDVVGVLAAAVLVLFVFKMGETHPRLYSGGFALTSVISAVLIAVAVHPRTYIGRALGVTPLRWVGVRAYSLYLWHWPVFMLTRPHIDVPMSGVPLVVLQLGLTLALADVSYRFVETPIRNGFLGRTRRKLMQLPKWPAWQQGATVTGTAGLFAGAVVFSASVLSARAPQPPDYLNNLPKISGVLTAASTPPAAAAVIPVPSGIESVPPAEATTTQAATPAPSTATPAATAAPPAPTSTEAATVAETNPNGSAFTSSVASSSSSSSTSVPPAPTAPPTDAALGVTATSIGDSVMLGAAYELARVLGSVDVDAAVGRQMNVVLQIIEARKAQGLLADTVIVQVGNNGPISKDQFAAMMDLLSDQKRVVVLNVKVPLQWQDPNNAIISEGVKHYKNAVFVDWDSASEPHPEYFWTDNVHLRPEGAAAYVALIAAALR